MVPDTGANIIDNKVPTDGPVNQQVRELHNSMHSVIIRVPDTGGWMTKERMA